MVLQTTSHHLLWRSICEPTVTLDSRHVIVPSNPDSNKQGGVFDEMMYAGIFAQRV